MQEITSGLALAILIGYGCIVVYNGLSFVPLCYARSKREQRDLRRASKSKDGEVASSVDIYQVFWWIALIGFYTSFCYIHSTTVNPYSETAYVMWGVRIAYFTAPFVLRKFLIFPKSKVLQGFCALCDTVCFSPIRNHLLLIAVVLAGFYRTYWFTFALLDVMTMSKTLEKVILR